MCTIIQSYLKIQKNPESFPGIVKLPFVNEKWRDLALWLWAQARREGYSMQLDPIRYWLEFGFHGARLDALHFAYNFWTRANRKW